MCGIFLAHQSNKNKEELDILFEKIHYRGPDFSGSFMLDKTYYGFHRLAIINPSSGCNQPFYDSENKIVLICNGEIYNWHELCKKYELPEEESSDCEVILHLYKKIGFSAMVKELNGEFAIILHDRLQNKIYACRDICGTRPLYFSYCNGHLYLASELKCIPNANVNHIKPRNIYIFSDTKYEIQPYWIYPSEFTKIPVITENYTTTSLIAQYNDIADDLYKILYDSVAQRLETDREKGFFLSGGIDSSIICALAQKIYSTNERIKCFTIGMDDSPDVLAAKEVAQFLNVDLTVIPFNIQQAINDLPELIWHLETYDITTIRASAAQFTACKWIANNTDIKVVYSGEVADELLSSYLYSKFAPNLKALHKDAVKLLSEIHYFDALRLDRTCASQGLECRVPYMNREYIEYVLKLHPEFRRCDNQIEKYIIRHMACKYNLLPTNVINRQKNAFSDGISGKSNWISALKKYALETFADIDFINEMKKYEHLQPETLEQLLYRKLFESTYPDREHILPHFWMPKWCNANDPSASVLNVFNNE